MSDEGDELNRLISLEATEAAMSNSIQRYYVVNQSEENNNWIRCASCGNLLSQFRTEELSPEQLDIMGERIGAPVSHKVGGPFCINPIECDKRTNYVEWEDAVARGVPFADEEEDEDE